MAHFNSNQFHFDPATKVLSQEISTLSAGSRKPVFHQVYSDACDEGITIESSETGFSIDFAVDGYDYNGQGEDREICGWKLIPTRESLRKLPPALRERSKNLRVLIIND